MKLKAGDLVKKKKAPDQKLSRHPHPLHHPAGYGLVLWTDNSIAKIQWSGDWGTLLTIPSEVELVNETR